MTPIPRRIGWLFMLIALGIAVAARQFGVNHYGPIPALVVVLLVGGIGVMLVFTDMMVRALYAQVESQSRAPAAAGAVAEGDALASQGSGLRRSAANIAVPQSPSGWGRRSASRIARHSPSMVPSINSGRKRR